ncbi:hypothetical protein PDE_06291 [Penicillium oxalicum 114-2]|uniref:BTB domain-containing protein n=1 Tax=Penicillium oxalicum (strain 114-2 / CGMCC 5302) TaxID=933388 RepID=S7ZRQ3_PENO1|nr:hypothetical protein PDE_06291 [Penicillium oxalicum 114-2]
MNNGHTRESKHRIAVLEEEDVETFVAFCEYAYTGDYKVPALPVECAVSTKTPASAPTRQNQVRPALSESGRNSALSWRGTYRSDSFSSVLPPPVPSPPPESLVEGQEGMQENAVHTVPEESALREAHEDSSRAESPDVVEEEEEAVAAAQSELPVPTPEKEAAKSSENSEEAKSEQATESSETSAPSENIEPATTETEEHAAPEEPSPAKLALTEPADSSKEKKSKKSKSKKTKNKLSSQPPETEPPASLTPPSTPPPPEAEPIIQEGTAPAEIEEQPAVDELHCPPSDEQREEGGDSPCEKHSESSIPAVQQPSLPAADVPKSPESTKSFAEDGIPPASNSKPSTPSPSRSPTPSTAQRETISPRPMLDMSFAQQRFDTSPRPAGLNLWEEFTALQYEDEVVSVSTPRFDRYPSPQTLQGANPPYLTFHAKLYVFATRYLIPALAQLCLRKLHNDLVHLPLDTKEMYKEPESARGEKVNMSDAQGVVLDLLHYAYTRTARLEPITPTSATQLRENELRRLVVHYAACRVKQLASWHAVGDSGMATPIVAGYAAGVKGSKPMSMKALLDQTPELASDLVYRMM